MTKREMTSLLIKLMGIYALVQFVPGLVQSMVLLASNAFNFTEQPWYFALVAVLTAVLGPIFWIVLCLGVIFKSDALAKRLYRQDSPAGQLTTLGVEDFQRLGYHIIGLLLIVQAFPRIVTFLGQSLFLMRDSHSYRDISGTQIPFFLAIVTQLAIGLFLFISPHGLLNIWTRIQGKEAKPFQHTPEDSPKE